MSIRVFICGKYEDVFHETQDAILKTYDLELAGLSADCEDIIEKLFVNQVQVLLMCLENENAKHLQTIANAKAQLAETKIMVMSKNSSADYALECIKSGASGYLYYSDTTTSVLQAMVDVAHGGVVIHPEVTKKIIAKLLHIEINRTQQPSTQLTKRENEILQLLAEGHNYKSVAEIACISYSTVNYHIKNIYVKLNISSVGEAIAFYYKYLKS